MIQEGIITDYEALRAKFDIVELNGILRILELAAREGGNRLEAYLGVDCEHWDEFIWRGRRHGERLAENNRFFPNAGEVPGQSTEPLFDEDYLPSKLLRGSGEFHCSSTSRSPTVSLRRESTSHTSMR